MKKGISFFCINCLLFSFALFLLFSGLWCQEDEQAIEDQRKVARAFERGRGGGGRGPDVLAVFAGLRTYWGKI